MKQKERKGGIPAGRRGELGAARLPLARLASGAAARRARGGLGPACLWLREAAGGREAAVDGGQGVAGGLVREAAGGARRLVEVEEVEERLRRPGGDRTARRKLGAAAAVTRLVWLLHGAGGGGERRIIRRGVRRSCGGLTRVEGRRGAAGMAAGGSGGRGREVGDGEKSFPRDDGTRVRVGVVFAPQPSLLQVGRGFEGWTLKFF